MAGYERSMVGNIRWTLRGCYFQPTNVMLVFSSAMLAFSNAMLMFLDAILLFCNAMVLPFNAMLVHFYPMLVFFNAVPLLFNALLVHISALLVLISACECLQSHPNRTNNVFRFACHHLQQFQPQVQGNFGPQLIGEVPNAKGQSLKKHPGLYT